MAVHAIACSVPARHHLSVSERAAEHRGTRPRPARHAYGETTPAFAGVLAHYRDPVDVADEAERAGAGAGVVTDVEVVVVGHPVADRQRGRGLAEALPVDEELHPAAVVRADHGVPGAVPDARSGVGRQREGVAVGDVEVSPPSLPV